MPNYQSNPEIAKLSYMAIKRWLKANAAIEKKLIDNAGTKSALLNLAEEHSIDLSPLTGAGAGVVADSAHDTSGAPHLLPRTLPLSQPEPLVGEENLRA